VSQALQALRLVGVNGPYTLALGADAYTIADEATDDGYPLRKHLAGLVDGEIVWAPALHGGFLMSTRGGDFELRLGSDRAAPDRTRGLTQAPSLFRCRMLAREGRNAPH
jgi:uncharacterized linocin/CFP29 family protein